MSNGKKKNILWIKIDPLHPVDSGGKIRTYNMLKEWKKLHDITYLSLICNNVAKEELEKAGEYSNRQIWIQHNGIARTKIGYGLDLLRNLLFTRLPYIVDKYRHRGFTRLIKKEIQERDYDLIVCDFLQSSHNLISSGVSLQRAVLFQHNVESLIWKRHADECRNRLLRNYLKIQWKRCFDYEERACGLMAAVIAVSSKDAEYFKGDMGLNNIRGYVDTGVDIEFFEAHKRNPTAGNMVFLGAMDWRPNIDGVIRFANETLPLIQDKIPNATLTVVGRNPVDRVRKLASRPGIEITGTVDDVRPFLHRAQISVVPLYVGSGTRIKIFELMAAGVPVVSTSIGAEGLQVSHDENILLADSSQAFAEQAVRLMQDRELENRLSANAHQLVSENHSWQRITEEFDLLCEPGNA